VQARWSSVAIEQHGDAGVVTVQADNDAKLVSQTRTPNGSKLTHLEANADCNSICFQIHGYTPQTRKIIPLVAHRSWFRGWAAVIAALRRL
jgi:hypothetical protein